MKKKRITLQQALNAVPAINKLLVAEDLPIALSYRVGLMASDLSEHVNAFHRERGKLLAKDQIQNVLDMPLEKQEAVIAALNTLSQEPVIVRIPKAPLTPEVLATAKVKLTPADQMALDWLLPPVEIQVDELEEEPA